MLNNVCKMCLDAPDCSNHLKYAELFVIDYGAVSNKSVAVVWLLWYVHVSGRVLSLKAKY